MQLSVSLVTGICEDDTDDGDDVSDLEGVAPTPTHRRLARKEVLERSLTSGLYPQFIGCEGPYQLLDPSENMSLHSCSWFGFMLYVN